MRPDEMADDYRALPRRTRAFLALLRYAQIPLRLVAVVLALLSYVLEQLGDLAESASDIVLDACVRASNRLARTSRPVRELLAAREREREREREERQAWLRKGVKPFDSIENDPGYRDGGRIVDAEDVR